MQGYWEADEHTHESIDQAGQMHSGDLATLDSGQIVLPTHAVKAMAQTHTVGKQRSIQIGNQGGPIGRCGKGQV